MSAYFSDASADFRTMHAQLQHAHLPDVRFDVQLLDEGSLRLVVLLPLETGIDREVLLQCAKDAGEEDCFYHPDTDEVLYLLYDGCEPDLCFTLASLIERQAPAKGLEWDVRADRVVLF